jgi:hypothetical protein
LSALFVVSAESSAEVARYLSFDMNGVNDFELIKSRTYTGNETSMIRTQLDRQFGNDNGFLDQSEVESFRSSYNNYLDQSEWILMGEAYIVKRNATVILDNLEGSTSDTSKPITTTFTFSASSPAEPQGREHYFKFSRELWKYVDLEGAGVYTADNNLTFVAPANWQISYSQGLVNTTLMDDGRILTANANLHFEWIQVKISANLDEEPNNVDGNSSMNPLYLGLITTIVAISIILVLVVVVRRTRSGTLEDVGSGESHLLSESEIKELESEKEKIKADIILVRRDLRTEKISKEVARTRERALKEKLKALELKLRSTK